MTVNPWVRPYVLTAGRTRTRHRLFVHTLVSVPHADHGMAVPKAHDQAEALEAVVGAVREFILAFVG
jgi:hypothetical protein